MEEKLTKREMEILELIRQGKSKSTILLEMKTTPNIVNNYFSSIYKKTDCLVCYRSAKTKFEELQGFLRNNPTAFTVATNESNQIDLQTIEGLKAQKENLKKQNAGLVEIKEKLEKEVKELKEHSNIPEPKTNIDSVLMDLKIKYDMEKYNAHIKLEVLDEIKTKLSKKEQQHAAN